MTDALAALEGLQPWRVGVPRWKPDPALGVKILERYKAGCSGNQIGEAIGISPSTVLRWIRDQDDAGS